MTNELKLRDLRSESKNINVKVKVLEKDKERNVTVKKDNTKHRVANFIISDETSSIFLTVWDDEIDNIPIKETIIINNGYVSEFGGKLYLNIGRFGNWEIAGSKITKVRNPNTPIKYKDTSENSHKKIESLLPNQKDITLIAKVVEISEIRKVKIKKNNSDHEVAEFLIADETGCIILSLWDNYISNISGYNVIEIKGAYITEYKGGMRLNMSKSGSLKEYDEPTEFFFSDINIENNLSLNEYYKI
ncbi:MAG: hypothetical protein EAX96_09540 [Candidatus Lokiarchaeota archaeon]|nr:hypothetical protein [Candidatus Lokiarchaeota archaeon]